MSDMGSITTETRCPRMSVDPSISDMTVQRRKRRNGPVSTASASKALILLSSLTGRISSSCGRSGFSFAAAGLSGDRARHAGIREHFES
jgi:hypothetical protein